MAQGFTSQLPLPVASQANMETGTSNTVVVTPGVAQFHQSAAKVWILFNTVTTTTITTSYNVTSLTDNGTGDTTITFTVAFSSSNYALSGSTGGYISGNAISGVYVSSSTAPTASAVRVATTVNTGSVDYGRVSVIIFGDQA